jgi:hypothetical protein
MADKITISNTRTGLETDVRSFLLPMDGYPQLSNIYNFRGREQRRLGNSFLGRLVQRVVSESEGTVTTPWLTFSGTLTNLPISPKSVIITVGAITFTDTGTGVLIGSPSTNTGTINYTTGAFTLNFNPALGGNTAVTALYEYFTGRPVMGLPNRDIQQINQEQLIAFDTVKANLYSSTAQAFRDISFYQGANADPVSWTGTNYQFFWTTNYQFGFFATNNVPGFHAFPILTITTGATTTVTFTGGDVFADGDIVTFVLAVNTTPATGTAHNGFTGVVSAHGAGTVTFLLNTTGDVYTADTGYIQNLTNTVAGDGIRWYSTAGWVNYQPPVDSTDLLLGTLILLPYKGYFIALSTWEGPSLGAAVNYQQRARIMAPGSIYYNNLFPVGFAGGFQVDGWDSDIGMPGDFVDAPTGDIIIGAEFIKDTLIVKFNRSTWQLRYTGDPAAPFLWEQINTELGADATFSMIPFDDQVLSVGNYGITRDNSVQVQRIDQKIPQAVFQIRNDSNGVQRVYGQRDYTKQLAYWTFPSEEAGETAPVFPNRILVYNYLDNSWSFFEDSLTALGTFQPFNDATWADVGKAWADCNFSWAGGPIQAGYPVTVGGNQVGFVFAVNFIQTNNDPSLYVTGVTNASPGVVTAPNHNLNDGEFIAFSQVLGMTQLNGYTDPINISSPDGIFVVNEVLSADTFSLGIVDLRTNVDNNPSNPPNPNYGLITDLDTTNFGVFTTPNSALIAIVSNFSILSKQFAPYLDDGLQSRLMYVDTFMQVTGQGQISLNFFKNQNTTYPSLSRVFTPSAISPQQIVWTRTNVGLSGQFISVQMTFNNVQMATKALNNIQISLDAITLTWDKAGRFMPGSPI